MQAYVYKSLRKADTYVYLSARDDFARLPDPLRTQLGNLQFVLEVALSQERQLARESEATRSGGTAARVAERPPATLGGRPIEEVRENLVARGFHLQFPPTVEDPMTEDWGTDA